MDVKTIGQAAALGGRERFVERGDGVGVEVIHNQAHLDGLGVALLEHAFDEARPVLSRAAFGDCDMAATGQRFHLDKEHGHAMAHVFMIGDGDLAGLGRDGRMGLADQLLAGLIHADHGEAGIVGQPVDVQDIFHRGDKSGVPIGRDLPVFAQMRLQLVFLASAARSPPRPHRRF